MQKYPSVSIILQIELTISYIVLFGGFRMQLFETERIHFDKLVKKEMQTLKGKGNHVGSAVGKTVFFSPCEQLTAKIKQKSGTGNEESKRYFDAKNQASAELRRLYGELRPITDAAWIFLMQLILLDDDLFSHLPTLYLAEGKSAEETVRLIRDYFIHSLCGGAGGENLIALSLDVDDVATRILKALGSSIRVPTLPQSSIIVSNSPLPSFVAEHREKISGIVTRNLPPSSSIIELSHSLLIPLICTDGEISESLTDKNALIDGAKGCLYVDPDLATLSGFTEASRSRINEEKEGEENRGEIFDKEGKRINFLVELDSPNDVKKLRPSLCDGIGKFSSEELYLIDMCPPDEELLFDEYRKIAETMPTKPVIIRAFKTEGGVHLSSLITESDNGTHGELYVTYDTTLRNQLRAVMRAAAYGTLYFCLPSALRYSDLFTCASLMEEIAGELYEEEREYNPVPLGVCVCDAASAIMCEKLLEECDFLVIDLEKLCESLSANANFSKKSHEDNVPLNALRLLLCSIIKSAKKKKRKTVLSLGKSFSADNLPSETLDGFLNISCPQSLLSNLKKQLAEKQKG